MAVKLHPDGVIEFNSIEELKAFQQPQIVEKPKRKYTKRKPKGETVEDIVKKNKFKYSFNNGKWTKIPIKKKRQYRRRKHFYDIWNEEEDKQVVEFFKQFTGRVPKGLTKKFAKKLGRTTMAVRARRKELKKKDKL